MAAEVAAKLEAAEEAKAAVEAANAPKALEARQRQEAKRVKEAERKRERVRRLQPGLLLAQAQEQRRSLVAEGEVLRLARIANDSAQAAVLQHIKDDEKADGWTEVKSRNEDSKTSSDAGLTLSQGREQQKPFWRDGVEYY